MSAINGNYVYSGRESLALKAFTFRCLVITCLAVGVFAAFAICADSNMALRVKHALREFVSISEVSQSSTFTRFKCVFIGVSVLNKCMFWGAFLLIHLQKPIKLEPTPLPAETISTYIPGMCYLLNPLNGNPYVQVGDQLTENTVVCVMEAMKMQHQIRAGVRGRIERILVQHGEIVNPATPLFLIAPDA